MEVSAKDFYAKTIRRLSPKKRLRLAALILQDLTTSNGSVEFGELWTDEDLNDLSNFTLSHSENPHASKKKKKSKSGRRGSP